MTSNWKKRSLLSLTSNALFTTISVVYAMQTMSGICADTSISVLMSTKDRLLLGITLKSNKEQSQITYILRKCWSSFDCLIYEMLFIKELKPTLNKQYVILYNFFIVPVFIILTLTVILFRASVYIFYCWYSCALIGTYIFIFHLLLLQLENYFREIKTFLSLVFTKQTRYK